MQDIPSIFQNSGIDDSKIIEVQKLWWMSNDNYKITTWKGKYFMRFEKTVKSDNQYRWKFHKEYKISQTLSDAWISPKILYFSDEWE